MAILQAYQADVLKKMDEGGGLTPEAGKDFCKATDLALRATKHTARAVGRSMAGSVAAERHLWLHLMFFSLTAPSLKLDYLGRQSALWWRIFGPPSLSQLPSGSLCLGGRGTTLTPPPHLESGPWKEGDLASRSSAQAHPSLTMVWGAHSRPLPNGNLAGRLILSSPTGLPLQLHQVVPDSRVRMRRVSPETSRGRARPFKRFCLPLTHSPHSDRSNPPRRFQCAANGYLQMSFSVAVGRHIGPSPPTTCSFITRVIRDTFGSLPQPTSLVPATFQSSTSVPVDSLILNKDAKGFPSWWTTSPPPDLLDTPTQVCLLDYNYLLPRSYFFHEWEHLPDCNIWERGHNNTILSGHPFGQQRLCIDIMFTFGQKLQIATPNTLSVQA